MSQRSFTSPAQATNDLVKAAKSRDRRAIREIFGPEVTNLWTGDKTLDERHFDEFASDLAERCDAVREGTNKVTLEIGKELWPFPIPLIQTNGAWIFDTMAGEEEIINRHIGRDEYYAIGVCRAYVKAQREYAGRFSGSNGAPKYAEKFRSTPGKMDGLYWPEDAIGTPSPLSPFVAQAAFGRLQLEPRQRPASVSRIFFQDSDAARTGRAGRKNELRHAWRNDRRLCVGGVSRPLGRVGDHDIHREPRRGRLSAKSGRKDRKNGRRDEGVQPGRASGPSCRNRESPTCWGTTQARKLDNGGRSDSSIILEQPRCVAIIGRSLPGHARCAFGAFFPPVR